MTPFERALMADHTVPIPAAARAYLSFRAPLQKEAEALESVRDNKRLAQAARVQALSAQIRAAKDKGLSSGITQATKNRVLDRVERRQNQGKAVGGTVGALGGAVAGKKLIGGRSGTIAGMVAGYLSGSRAGSEAGKKLDWKRGLAKRAAPIAAAVDGAGTGITPAAMAPAGAQGTPELQPTNYFGAEILGQQAQEQAEGAFLSQRTAEAEGAARELEQELQRTQAELSQAQVAAQSAQEQLQQATQDALAAHDVALQNQQVAANLRMGMQRMRAQMVEVASQDPAAEAAEVLQSETGVPDDEVPQPPIDGAGGQLPPEGDSPPIAPAPPQGAAPPAPGGGAPPKAPAPGGAAQAKTSNISPKMRAALGFAAAGAAAGAGYSALLRGKSEKFEKNRQALEGSSSSFASLLRTPARVLADDAAQAKASPMRSMATQMGRGALAGGLLGPQIQGNAASAAQNLKDMRLPSA